MIFNSVSQNKRQREYMQDNEMHANRDISKVILVIAFIYLVVGILVKSNIFKASAIVSTGLFIFGAIFTAVAVIGIKGKSVAFWIKYAQFAILLISIFWVNAFIGYRIWMLYAVVVMLSVRYINRRFTAYVGILAMLLAIASSFTNAYWAAHVGIMDLNVVSFSEPGSLDYYSWLFNAVIKHGFDVDKIVINGLRLSALPNCIAIVISIIVGESIIANGNEMVNKIITSLENEITLFRQAVIDELTGLFNRRAYEKDLENIFAEVTENQLIYISMDVNGLKNVNDNIGHVAGDELIRGACYCMKNVFGPHGKIYRTGGDEFVALLKLSKEKVEGVLAEFDSSIASWRGELIDEVSVSYGFVSKEDFPEESILELAARAEKKMYEAKAAHYRKKGFDRRGQKDAHKRLCELYTKILSINLTEDTYQIINMDLSEQNPEKGFEDKISEWLTSFGRSGQVHPDDLSEYLRQTDVQYIKDYFDQDKTSLHIFYRRKYGDAFKQVMMEIVPADDFSKENMSMFLYVKDIDK